MKVAGFTIARNVIKYDYPIREAILSVLPLCDAFYVAVGKSDDDTLNYIRSIGSDKLHIIETVWDESLREGGLVLSQETNKAFDAIPAEYNWAFYIQGDEVLHEQYYAAVKESLLLHLNNPQVQGLLFDYVHFYGTYAYVADSRNWYRNEIRIVRNDKKIRSYKDAQGFRTLNNEKLNVKRINASIYHYGWVKPPKAQQEKQKTFHKMWHDDQWVQKNVGTDEEFDYSNIDSLKKFDGTHPQLMKQRVAAQNWNFVYDPLKIKLKLKDRLLRSIEKGTGWRIGEYKNFKLI